MSLARARILKADPSASVDANASPGRNETLARRVPAVVVDVRLEADRIMREASTAADAIVASARASVAELTRNAAREAREQEVARVVAELVALRIGEEQRAERDLDRTIEIAALLAERLVGDTIALQPARIATLAQGALHETRGARRMRIEACKDDVPALQAMFEGLGDVIATIEASDELARGSLVVHTELGRIDARLAPQLTRLAEALREALRVNQKDGSRRSSQE